MNSIDTEKFQIKLEPSVDNYAVMGNPIIHSKSPAIHLAFAHQTGQILNYQSIYVPVGKFDSAIRLFQELGGKGLNITLPFKHDAHNLSVNMTQRAKTAAAVNTIKFNEDGVIEGDNTDGAGLVRDLQRNSIQVVDKRILILGAGGAVSGILSPLLEQQPESITIANRTLVKAEALVSLHHTATNLIASGLSELEELGSFDVVINATSSGLNDELPVLPSSIIDEGSICYDMVYGIAETVFVSWSKSLGAKVALDGLGMLVEQAAESFYIWRGIRPDTVPVIEMLRNDVRKG
ncbi:MAG: shikimate dehydrogenase [Gammaproteobacteria bacterium]|jgi:shikimate dehydrogenase